MVIQSPLAKAAAAVTAAVPPLAPAAAAPADVARFAAAIAPPPDAAVHHATPFSVPPQAEAAAPPASLGQAILDGMNGVRRQFDDTMTGIRSVLDNAATDLSARDMLSIQMQISMLTLQQDLMGKIVGKSTQNVDQLLKAQ